MCMNEWWIWCGRPDGQIPGKMAGVYESVVGGDDVLKFGCLREGKKKKERCG